MSIDGMDFSHCECLGVKLLLPAYFRYVYTKGIWSCGQAVQSYFFFLINPLTVRYNLLIGKCCIVKQTCPQCGNDHCDHSYRVRNVCQRLLGQAGSESSFVSVHVMKARQWAAFQVEPLQMLVTFTDSPHLTNIIGAGNLAVKQIGH